jgi:shikimate dehydrogenase
VILGVVYEERERLAEDARKRGGARVTTHSLTPSTLAAQMATADVVLHCTPIGMHPEEGKSLVPPDLWRAGMTVFDAVYNPRRTQLLHDAHAAGCRVVEGLEMFLGQAYVQFDLWTGQPAPRAVMRNVLEERL